MTEEEQRAAVVAEARRWLRTPYHPMGRIRGVGVDCAMLPAEIYAACGLIPLQNVERYAPDWHLHRGGERFLSRVLEHAHEVEIPCSGDLVLYRMGRALAHAAIVISWPRIIHAAFQIGVIEDDGMAPSLAHDRRAGRREKHFYSLWANERDTP